ncbi:uL15 family ribosomal protein [Candidatus Bathyarchaeota archaeon]|nr:uL15 family ribosomal protein [Candidatus Bathyarchaeota archaeon]
MPHRLRKIRKKRGSRTCGYGRVGQHRKSGSKGYRKAGRHKHGWSYVVKYEPEYFGKKGFTSPKSLRREVKAINVGELEEIAQKCGGKTEEEKILIDLGCLGYTKLLGAGKVTRPLIVKVAICSKSAAEKIEEAGGQVLTGVQESGE